MKEKLEKYNVGNLQLSFFIEKRNEYFEKLKKDSKYFNDLNSNNKKIDNKNNNENKNNNTTSESINNNEINPDYDLSMIEPKTKIIEKAFEFITIINNSANIGLQLENQDEKEELESENNVSKRIRVSTVTPVHHVYKHFF